MYEQSRILSLCWLPSPCVQWWSLPLKLVVIVILHNISIISAKSYLFPWRINLRINEFINHVENEQLNSHSDVSGCLGVFSETVSEGAILHNWNLKFRPLLRVQSQQKATYVYPDHRWFFAPTIIPLHLHKILKYIYWLQNQEILPFWAFLQFRVSVSGVIQHRIWLLSCTRECLFGAFFKSPHVLMKLINSQKNINITKFN